MKKIYILALSILSVNAASAQITLTAANNNPSVGDSFTSQTFDGSIFNPGMGGANVTWNFASITSQSSSTGAIVAPTSFLEGANHPLANVASGDATNQAYFFIDNDEFSQVGTSLTGVAREVFTDPKEWYKFPITFGDSFNETFDGTIDNIAASQVFDRGGTILIEADAYGTLIMPYGTVNNVLRLKTTSDFTDAQGGFPLISYNEVRYTWFNANTKVALLSYVIITPSLGPATSVATYIDPSNVVTGLGDDLVQSSPILMYPNPANDQVKISLDREYNEATIQMIDVSGKIVRNKQVSYGDKNVSIQLDELDKGIYFVQIIEGGNLISTEKLMVN